MVDDTLILLLGEPHGIDDLLDVLVSEETLPVSLCRVHFLENILV